MTDDPVELVLECVAAELGALDAARREAISRRIRERLGGQSVYIAIRRAELRGHQVAPMVRDGCSAARVADALQVSARHARRLIAKQKKSEARTLFKLEMSSEARKLSEV